MQKRFSIGLVAGMAFVLATMMVSPSRAQDDEEKFTNLKVFDTSISRDELIGKMRGFSNALGVRCDFCHKEVEAGGRTSLDFASDEKQNKLTARAMLIMMADINNSHLAKLQQDGGTSPTVSCFTCHHGYREPVLLGNEIEGALTAGGVDSAKALYNDLKSQFYGQAVYDFSERSLTLSARDLAKSGKIDDALSILKLNEQQFPESMEIKEAYALIYADAGKIPEAIAACEKVLAVDPDNRHMKRLLGQLQGK